jgi:DNA-binding transcriptional ArsR family regulator
MKVTLLPTKLTQDNESILFDDTELEAAVRIFKALSDQTRVRTLSILTMNKDYCVSDIASMLKMDISRVSHQLTKLEDLGFIRRHKSGKNAYYQISDDCIRSILGRAKEHVAGI